MEHISNVIRHIFQTPVIVLDHLSYQSFIYTLIYLDHYSKVSSRTRKIKMRMRMKMKMKVKIKMKIKMTEKQYNIRINIKIN